MKKLTIITAVFLALATPASAYKAGTWEITPASDSCLATQYAPQGGVTLHVSVGKDYNWGIGLTDPSWRLNPGATVPITAIVDGQIVAQGSAKFLKKDTAFIPLSGVHLYKTLRAGNSMIINHPAGNLVFNLQGTAVAMAEVVNCVRNLHAPAPQVARNDVTILPPEDIKGVVSDLMTKNGSQYTIVSAKAGEEVVFNYDNGKLGKLIIATGNTKNVDDYTSLSLGDLAKPCVGNFMSGVKVIATTDGSASRRIDGECRTQDATISVTAVIIRTQTGTLMRLVTAEKQGDEQGWKPAPKAIPDASDQPGLLEVFQKNRRD